MPKTEEQKAAWSKYVRGWQNRNPEKAFRSRYYSYYRIDFDQKWEAQQGLCACCGTSLKRGGYDPDSACADHDRVCCPGKKSCGKCFRGLIHRNCNLIIGFAKDDIHRLEGLSSYLRRQGS